MRNVFKIAVGLFAVLLVTGCRTASASFYKHETECLGVELDGSQTLKSWGTGRYWKDAADQAKKNAVRDVVFKGNFIGTGECEVKPLLLEVNAEEKYKAYFNAFFKDGGEYARYVSLRDERIPRHIIRVRDSRNKDQSLYSVVVRVERAELREKLINDGILKK
ncbi:MAG: hypothetical protein LBT04_07520 [Prevotellaceae bacterium]|nr:hypothetical protein [Prevotellaceae bacterium]